MRTLKLFSLFLLSLVVSCATEPEMEKEVLKADANGVVIKSSGDGIFSISGANPVPVEQFESLVVGSAWREKSRWNYINGELDPKHPGNCMEGKDVDSDFRTWLYFSQEQLTRYYLAELLFDPKTLAETRIYERYNYNYRYDDELRVMHSRGGGWEEIGIIIDVDENSFTVAHSNHYDIETMTPIYDDFSLSMFEKVDSSVLQKWDEMTTEAEQEHRTNVF